MHWVYILAVSRRASRLEVMLRGEDDDLFKVYELLNKIKNLVRDKSQTKNNNDHILHKIKILSLNKRWKSKIKGEGVKYNHITCFPP